MHAIWKMICIVKILKFLVPFWYFRVNTFSEFDYIDSCMPAAKVNHTILILALDGKVKVLYSSIVLF